MRKLHGLNIYNNPIEFPPSHIVKKGTREILKYLYESYFQQNQGENPSLQRFIENIMSLSMNSYLKNELHNFIKIPFIK